MQGGNTSVGDRGNGPLAGDLHAVDQPIHVLQPRRQSTAAASGPRKPRAPGAVFRMAAVFDRGVPIGDAASANALRSAGQGRPAFCRLQLALLGQSGLRRGKCEWNDGYGGGSGRRRAGQFVAVAGREGSDTGTGVAEQGELHGRPAFHGRRSRDAGGVADAASAGTGGITGGPADVGNAGTDGAVATWRFHHRLRHLHAGPNSAARWSRREDRFARSTRRPVPRWSAMRAPLTSGAVGIFWTTRAAWSGNPPAACAEPCGERNLNPQRAQAGVKRGGDQRRRLDREQPGPDDAEGDAPAHARRAVDAADADDAAGDGVRGRHRDARARWRGTACRPRPSRRRSRRTASAS